MGPLSITAEYDRTRINGVDYHHLIEEIHVVTMSVCSEMGGICIDLANELEWELDDFYDWAHNTPPGAEKIGHFVYERLKDRI